MKKNNLLNLAFPLLILLIFISCNQQGGPSQFRLSQTGNDLPDEWSSDKNIRWTYDLQGRGWSSPIVSGDKVFITTAYNETKPPKPEEDAPPPPPPPQPGTVQIQGPPAGQGQGQGRPQGTPPPRQEDTTYRHEVYRWDVICLDLKSGKEIWKQVARRGNPRTGTNPGNGYAAETPATDGKRVYAYFGMTGLFCYDLNGSLLWEKDLGAFKTQNSWGTGSSPVLYNGLLYIQVDNEENSFITALDAITGEEKWRVQRDEKTSYSTPFIWTNKLRTELVSGGLTFRSYDPATGNLFWECKVGGRYSIPSPSADKEMLYIGNAGGPDKPGNLYAIKAGAKGDISLADSTVTQNEWVAWSIPDAGTGNPSPLLYNGRIYLLASRGGDITCFDAATGKTIYKEKIDKVAACWASPWVFNDKIYFTDERGITYVFRAGDKFELITQNRIADKFWASPGVGEDAYVFKGVNKVYCVGK